MIETDVIVLKTTPYQDSSLILKGLSPDLGRISIYAKGARKISKKSFPSIGLFRVLTTSIIQPKTGDLYKLKNCEAIEINDTIAGYPDLVDFSSAIGQLSLSSNFNGIPCPLYFHAFKECINQLKHRPLPFSAWLCRLITCHLMEQGLFPEMTLSPNQKKIIEALLDKDFKASASLNLSNEQWSSMQSWILKIAEFSEIQLPINNFFSAC
ncbi:MAG: recombination protein O N-terminal domain-containing protein [Lentisphaerales bacterium]|nr:recombination protein O N-terminal domain-containing protein [Lentisphaerales bacterium]